MKAVVFQAAGRQEFRIRRIAGTAKRTRGAKARVVDQDDENVRRALGRAQLRDRRELRIRILCIIGNEARARPIRDGKNGSLNVVLRTHDGSL